MKMRPRRLKVEFYDSDGVRHSIAIDGPVTKEKVGKILDLVELMSGTPQTSATAFREKIPLSTVSTYLTRLADRGVLEREQEKFGLLYRVRLEGQKQSLAPDPSLQ